METKIIKIGNSKGLRLSKTVLDKYEIKDTIQMILEEDCIILKPIPNPRIGWGKEFKKMHERGDDQLLIDDIFEEEQLEEWK